jgi:mRNA interferase ChpB
VPVVLPITSGGGFARMRGFAVSLSGTGLATQGIICNHPRAIDLRARKVRRSRERVPDRVMNDVMARVVTLSE